MWTKEQENAARERLSNIRKPWNEAQSGDIRDPDGEEVAQVMVLADSIFIASSPTDLAAAFAEIDRLRAALQRIVDDYGKLSVELPHIIARAALDE